MRRGKVTLLTSAILLVLVPLTLVRAAEWQSEWEAALKGAKKEGKLVLAIPPSAELRKELEPLLKQKFGIEAELIVSRGADSANQTAKTLSALDQVIGNGAARIRVEVLVGKSNPHRQDIEQRCRILPWARFHFASEHVSEMMAVAACIPPM